MSGSYRDCIIPFVIVGIGVALGLAPCTESVMGSLPRHEAGVGSATNDTSMQVGGALGVGVLGTALNLRYEHLMASAVGHAGVPGSIRALIESSVGAALAVAAHVPGKLGDELALVARRSFISGMDLALVVAACVVGVAAVLVVALLPNRGTEVSEDGTAPGRGSRSGDGRHTRRRWPLPSRRRRPRRLCHPPPVDSPHVPVAVLQHVHVAVAGRGEGLPPPAT